MKFVITGGRGFIGSHFVDLLLSSGHTVVDIDKMTYASSRDLPWDTHPNYTLIEEDISTITHLPPCDVVVNFAAESHVDNSIVGPSVFFASNTHGVFNLLELIRGKIYNRPLFYHVSTDEVYGDVRAENSSEVDALSPGNPYSASKAAAEMFVLSYHNTYGVEYLITRSANNYGERQYPEKLVPQILHCLAAGKKIPIHGDGSYIRDWVYVKDNVAAMYHLLMAGLKNDIYNISANNHMTNLEVVKAVCDWHNVAKYQNHIEFVTNRMGQDTRYSMSSEKLLSTGYQFIQEQKGLYKFI